MSMANKPTSAKLAPKQSDLKKKQLAAKASPTRKKFTATKRSVSKVNAIGSSTIHGKAYANGQA